jgi:hypothetical protein
MTTEINPTTETEGVIEYRGYRANWWLEEACTRSGANKFYLQYTLPFDRDGLDVSDYEFFDESSSPLVADASCEPTLG